jgi:hypothetical protein
MPTWFPSYTNCATPSQWSPPPYAVMVLTALIGAAIGSGLVILQSWLPGAAAFSAMACIAGIQFCQWWLNVRLICLGGDRSAIGAIYNLEPPPEAQPDLLAFNLVDYDTDYSFNLLLWPFVPKDWLPQSYAGSGSDQYSTAAQSKLQADWPILPSVPHVPWSTVEKQVTLILAQASMASVNLGFSGQDAFGSDGEPSAPTNPPPPSPLESFLIHCEIEGAGFSDLQILLTILAAVFFTAALVYAIPVIGPVLSWILAALAWLAFLFGGGACQADTASPPSSGGWGGSFNAYINAANPDSLVDLAYVYGRWVYDSGHSPGFNELHPVHFMLKIGCAKQADLANGNWPSDLATKQAGYDAQFAANNAPGAAAAQAEPQNQWTLHPLLDGCRGTTPYPEPNPDDLIG